MAYVLARVGQSLSNSFRHFVCDETADLEKLKEDVKDAPMGSTCYIIDDGAFYGCRSLREVQWNDSLQTIGVEAFMDCKYLRTPVLAPEVVIGKNAFKGCR